MNDLPKQEHRRPAVWEAVALLAKAWNGHITLGEIEEIINKIIDVIIEEVKKQ